MGYLKSDTDVQCIRKSESVKVGNIGIRYLKYDALFAEKETF